MLRNLVACVALLASAVPALAWPLGGPLYSSRYPIPPSAFGYPLDDTNPTYFGGGRYREYYGYGRGYGLANYPPPVPAYPYPYRRYPPTPGYGLPPAPARIPAPPPSGVPARFEVHVPDDAEVWLEGTRMRQTGNRREFVSPPLTTGDRFGYEIRARWREDGREVEQVRNIVVHAGDRLVVKFPLPEEPESLPTPRKFPVSVDRNTPRGQD